MRLVIDANVIFSALIKDSLSAELIFREEFELYAPEFLLEELVRYKETILKKTSRSEEDFIKTVGMLSRIITLIPQAEYSSFIARARFICPDRKDIAYIALASRLGCGIWSNDKALKQQKGVRIYFTSELKGLID